jgi:hypothetical protein
MLDQFNDLPQLLVGVAHMHRSVSAVEVQPIKGTIAHYPLSDFPHILILNNKVDGGPPPRANKGTPGISLIGTVLI